MSETTEEQVERARILANQAQDTNLNVLILAAKGSDKALRVAKKTQTRTMRRINAWQRLLENWLNWK
jgi:hypothetical protein